MAVKNPEKVKQGKTNRKKGGDFELKVRHDLESKGWTVSKWQNNVELEEVCWCGSEGKNICPRCGNIFCDSHGEWTGSDLGDENLCNECYHNNEPDEKKFVGKLIPAKRKYNPFTKRPMAEGTGFPDFICYTRLDQFDGNLNHVLRKIGNYEKENHWEVIGVEVKSNGYLDKEEREKCKWLLENKIFSKILIAEKLEPQIWDNKVLEQFGIDTTKKRVPKFIINYKEFVPTEGFK